MLWPVPDLAGFLAGAWRMHRRVVDRRAGVVGRLTGEAHILPAPGGLTYVEHGDLAYGAFRGEARRGYRFVVTGPAAAEVRFVDGRLFHRLDLSIGVAELVHDCLPDRYRGRCCARSAERWTLTWCVAGPRKALVITTRYCDRTVSRQP